MEQSSPSRTAQGVALLRAAHQLLDSPKIFGDPLALTIVGEKAAAALREACGQPAIKEGSGLRAFIAMRSQLAEDSLAKAIEHGIGQYVLLGAGLDTSAYRNRHESLVVFEADHPATQAWKHARLEETKIAAHARVVYAPVDFTCETLSEGLTRASFDFSRPAFFTWLGVTPYLTREAISATLSFVASLPRGSEIVFDYAGPIGNHDAKLRARLEAMAARVAAAGEPFRSFFDPGELVELLKQAGFTHIEDSDSAALNARYFANRSDGLMLRGGGHVVLARI